MKNNIKPQTSKSKTNPKSKNQNGILKLGFVWKFDVGSLNFEKGFSLLEVMVAVAILAISLLALINFQGQSMFIVGRAEKLTLANFLARQKMAEVVLAIEKEQFQQGVFSEDKSESGAFEEPYEDYKWEWKMRKVEIPVPGGEEGGGVMAMLQMVSNQIKDQVREVKLTVTWQELGKEQGFDVVTHLSKM